MYMRLLRLKIKEESIPLVSDFYTRHALAPLQDAPSCQFASLLQSQQKPEELMSLTLWDSMEKAEAFSQSDVFGRLMEEIRPHLAEASEWKIQLSKEMELTVAPVQQELHIDSYQVAAQQELQPAGAAFIRFFSLIVKEGRIAEFERLYKNEILPALKATPGCIGAFLVENLRDPHHLISLTLWESALAAEEYEKSGRFAALLESVSPTLSEFFQWKLALDREKSASLHTSEDGKIDNYHLVLAKRFQRG